MSEYDEVIFVVAVYVFIVTALTMPFLVGYLFYRINKTVNRATKILDYVEDSEVENRKYHE